MSSGHQHEWAFRKDVVRRTQHDFIVKQVPGKGSGAFAARDFAAGELLFIEQPLVTWPADAAIMTKENLQSTLDAELRRLGPQKRARFESLSQASIHGLDTAPTVKTARGIWLTNALPSDDGGGTSVYADACRLNHSCAPNVHHSLQRHDRAQHLRIVTKVKQGEELFLSYIEGGEMSCAQRKEHLGRVFGFQCACCMCALEGDELVASDARRRRLMDLKEHMNAPQGPQAGCASAKELVRCVEERLSLMRREKLPATSGHADMMIAMESCRAAGDKRAASRWALRAAECVRLGAGETNPIYVQLKQLAGMLMAQAGVDPARYEF